MMDVLQWIWEGFVSGVLKIADLWWLVLLFIAIQVLKDAGWLDKVSKWMRPILAPLRLPGDAGLPVAAGLAVGLTYGSGIILQAGEEGKMSRAELTVACVFLGICHAVVEETILFSAAGASGTLLVVVRAVAGLVFAFGASRVLLKKA
ncbi:MAG TPA: nucleoside recognition domain-containing protein [Symbiobacteriaceae bacterium]|nr:nucleoside recognition domain-containing protein [Symbiobacteriaceae bacterium]